MSYFFEVTKLEVGQTFDHRSFRKIEGRVYELKDFGNGVIRKIFWFNSIAKSAYASFIMWDDLDGGLADLSIGDIIEGELINPESIIKQALSFDRKNDI